LADNELQLHRQRARLLADAPIDRRGWTLSDFWLEESVAFSEGAGDSAESFGVAFDPQVPRPKLVVILNLPEPATQPSGRLAERLSRLAFRPDVGPVLRIDAVVPPSIGLSAEEQIIAAVQAMQ
jgi:hypothetical protein